MHAIPEHNKPNNAEANECIQSPWQNCVATYAAPHALLGSRYLFAAMNAGRPLTEVAPVIRREARSALDLDPFETDPHFLLTDRPMQTYLSFADAGRCAP
jgi:hypothetical protein